MHIYIYSGVVAKSCLTLATPWTIARQAPLSMGFSMQEYWSGLPFPSPGDLPVPGIKLGFPALQADSLTNWATEEALCKISVGVIVRSCGNSVFSFLRNCQAFFHSGSTILPAVYKRSTFSTSLPIFFFFYYNHPDVCEVLSHCSFDFHFPYDKWCWASFHVPVDCLYISCGGISIQILCPLFLKNYLFFFGYAAWVVGS